MAFQLRQAAIACALAASALAAAPAMAHEAGDILVKVGASYVAPKNDNGEILGNGTKLSIGENARPSFTLTYMATQNIGVELLGALPFQHDIRASGLGNIGKAKHLPPTLSLQWHFLPESTIQPYVGVGVNYTRFFDEQSGLGKLKIDDSWGIAGQIGVDVKLSDRWFLNADVRYIDIDSDVHLNGVKIGKANIDPWVYSVGVGYRF